MYFFVVSGAKLNQFFPIPKEKAKFFRKNRKKIRGDKEVGRILILNHLTSLIPNTFFFELFFERIFLFSKKNAETM